MKAVPRAIFQDRKFAHGTLWAGGIRAKTAAAIVPNHGARFLVDLIEDGIGLGSRLERHALGVIVQDGRSAGGIGA